MPFLKLEDFAEAPEPATPAEAETEAQEELRLAAYEEGYGAGWEDATTAQSDARAAREAEVARHLQLLAFGYQEARHHVLEALAPLLEEMAAKVLPAMARDSLVPVVTETLMPLAERLADRPVTLRAAPDAREALERLLPTMADGLPFIILEDATLSGGVVLIDTGKAEARVDLDAAAAGIRQAITDFFDFPPIAEQANAG